MTVLRRTKIVVTMGPALDDPEVLGRVLEAGADVFRANFSHGTADDHAQRINQVRELAAKQGKEIAVFADLQGPKIRVSRFKDKSVNLIVGDTFVLDAALDTDAGDNAQVGIDYKNLPNDVGAGDTLLLDDGRVVLSVDKVDGQKIICKVEVGGDLSNNKGINRLGGGLSADALTDKDKEDLKTAISLGVEYIAVSFPRSAQDIEAARKLLGDHAKSIGIISKIERKEALDVIDEIINASDAVMVARGDLGVEIGDADLPAAQKMIIQQSRTLNKPVITATQMMESMIDNPIPTRAEVSDVANAVLDGTDAVMLSAETATGSYPDKAVEAMGRICLSAEKHPEATISAHRMECHFETQDEAIAMAAMYTANHIDVSAIATLTESGTTPLLMSRIRSSIPIYGLSRNKGTVRRMALYRGVYPIHFDVLKFDSVRLNEYVVNALEERGIVKKGEEVIITKGDYLGVGGHTNSMKIFTVGMFDK